MDHHQNLGKSGTGQRRRLLSQAQCGAPYHHVKSAAKESETNSDHWPQALSHRSEDNFSSASGKLLLLDLELVV